MAASSDRTSEFVCPCDDILRFSKALSKMRQSDDRFIYKLNTILPTQSFKSKTDPVQECELVYHQMLHDYNQRSEAVQKCIDVQKSRIKSLRERQAVNMDDMSVKQELNDASLMLKQFQKEMPQEEILRNKSFKLFYERCGDYYIPPPSS